MSRAFVRKWLIIMLPVFPLIDFFLFETFPAVTWCSYLLIMLLFSSLQFRYDKVLFVFAIIVTISLLMNGINKGFSIDQLKYFSSFVVFLMLGSAVGKNMVQYLDSIIGFVYMYFLINTLIYIYRLLQYSFDFNRVRTGISIFGGNTAHCVFLITLFLLKSFKDKRKHYYAILIIALTNSVMFVSKGAILITMVWIFLDVFNQKKTHFLNRKVVAIICITLVLIRIFLYEKMIDFFVYSIQRFAIWGDLYQNTGSFMGTRGYIFDFSVDYIKNHTSIILWGNGPTFFRAINPWGYSNTHNLLLDVMFDIGGFGLLVFLIIVIKTFARSNEKIYYLMCILYATIEGIALFFIDADSAMISGLTMFMIVVCYCGRNNYKKNILT